MNGNYPRTLDKFLLLNIYLLLFITPLFLIPYVRMIAPAITAKWLLVSFLSYSFIIFSLLYALYRGKINPRRSMFYYALLGFLLTFFLSSFVSGRWQYCLREALPHIGLLGVFLLASGLIISEAEAVRAKALIICAGTLVSLYGLCQYFGFDFLYPLFPYAFEEMLGRNYIFSTIGNPEYLGSFIAPLAALLLPGLLLRPLSLGHILNISIFLIFVTVIFLTGARGAFIGLLAGSGLIALSLAKNKKIKITRQHIVILLVALIIISGVLIIFSFPNPINKHNLVVLGRFKNLVNLRSDSIKERLLFYSLCTYMIRDHPVLGVGPGMFKVKFYPYVERLVSEDPKAGMQITLMDLKNRVPENAHNDLFQIWVEQGSIGWLAFSLAMVVLFVALWRKLTSPKLSVAAYVVWAGFGAAALCILVNSSFSFPLHTPARATLFWLMVTMLGSFCQPEAESSRR